MIFFKKIIKNFFHVTSDSKFYFFHFLGFSWKMYSKKLVLESIYSKQQEEIKHFKETERKIHDFQKKQEAFEIVMTKKFNSYQTDIRRYSDDYYKFSSTVVSEDYRGSEALKYVLQIKGIETVLDIGSGAGVHSALFAQHGKKVTAIDYGKSLEFKENSDIQLIIADFNEYEFDEQYDLVWCCHVLEHQTNPGLFLKKLHGLVKENGYIAITVPPLKQMIVGGHVTLWNAGLLLYHLVLAGFDCSQAHVKSYGYNVSVIVQKSTIDVHDKLRFDCGDLQAIQKYLPENLEWHPTEHNVPFIGGIKELNW